MLFSENTANNNDNDWNRSGNNIFTLSDSVGIGTSTPGAKLDVAGSSLFDHSKSGNVLIGCEAGALDTTDNKLYIENSMANSSYALIYGEFDNKILTFNADVGIGTSIPFAKLHVN